MKVEHGLRSVISASILLLGLLISFESLAQEKMKIATVDLNKIIQEAEAAKEAKEKLMTEYQKKQEKLKKMQEEILRLQDDMIQKSKFMAQQEIEKKRAEIESKQAEFLNALREAEMEIQQLDSRLTREVLEDVKKIISQIAEKENLDLVLEKSQVFFLRDADDITYKVIDEYNKMWSEKKLKRRDQQQRKR